MHLNGRPKFLAETAVQVQRTREAFEVQATHFRDVLTMDADSLVGFEHGIGARILALQALELSPYPGIDHGLPLNSAPVLLPGG